MVFRSKLVDGLKYVNLLLRTNIRNEKGVFLCEEANKSKT